MDNKETIEMINEKEADLSMYTKDLKDIEKMLKTKGREVYKKIRETYRKHLVKSVLNSVGDSEKLFSQDDLKKGNLRMINDIINLNNDVYVSIEKKIEALKSEVEILKDQLEGENIDELSVGDVDDLFNETL